MNEDLFFWRYDNFERATEGVLESTIQFNVYPWSVSTRKDMASFDLLGPEEMKDALAIAIEEGFSSDFSDKPILATLAKTKDGLSSEHKITQKAERDLKDIYLHIYLTTCQTKADDWLSDFSTVFEEICLHPEVDEPFLVHAHFCEHGIQTVHFRMNNGSPEIGRILQGAAKR